MNSCGTLGYGGIDLGVMRAMVRTARQAGGRPARSMLLRFILTVRSQCLDCKAYYI
jgi:hypothetical protein